MVERQTLISAPQIRSPWWELATLRSGWGQNVALLWYAVSNSEFPLTSLPPELFCKNVKLRSLRKLWNELRKLISLVYVKNKQLVTQTCIPTQLVADSFSRFLKYYDGISLGSFSLWTTGVTTEQLKVRDSVSSRVNSTWWVLRL